MTSLTIRDGVLLDSESVRSIYNHYVHNSVATFDTEPQEADARRQWFCGHEEVGLPIIVAEQDGGVVGWASLSYYHSRCAYKQTVEASVYLHPDVVGRGIGKQLLADLVVKARQKGYHVIIALVATENEASMRLFQSQGFEVAGCLKEVGRKFDRWLDVTLLQRLL